MNPEFRPAGVGGMLRLNIAAGRDALALSLALKGNHKKELTVATFCVEPTGVAEAETLDAGKGLLADPDDGGLALGSETAPARLVLDVDVTEPAAEGAAPPSLELFGCTMTIRNPSSLAVA
jgi:hypothetical protein